VGIEFLLGQLHFVNNSGEQSPRLRILLEFYVKHIGEEQPVMTITDFRIQAERELQVVEDIVKIIIHVDGPILHADFAIQSGGPKWKPDLHVPKIGGSRGGIGAGTNPGKKYHRQTGQGCGSDGSWDGMMSIHNHARRLQMTGPLFYWTLVQGRNTRVASIGDSRSKVIEVRRQPQEGRRSRGV